MRKCIRCGSEMVSNLDIKYSRHIFTRLLSFGGFDSAQRRAHD